MNRPTKFLPVPALAAALVLAAAGGRAQVPLAHSGHAPATASAGAKPAPLGDAVKAAVEEAFRDELRGEAIYARVLKDHGDVRPFSNVLRAERRHAAFLEDLLKARGLAVPAPPAGDVPAYATVREACAAAVAFEAQNVALYDRLLATGPLPDDVKRAFDHNRMASLDHHKPAFERCAGAAAGQGMARGAGRGHGARAARDGSRACGRGPGGASQGSGAGHGCGHGCGHGSPHGCGHGCGHGHCSSEGHAPGGSVQGL